MQICWNRRNVALVLLELLLVIFTANGQPPLHQQPSAAADQQKDGGLMQQLESMSEKELELLCIERGFELIQDDGGDPLSHADYVEAARRCLAIEEDMNEILEQNPELADELLMEIDRMKEEKARLERERDAMLEQSKKLEDKIAQKNQQQPTGPKADEPKRVWGGSSTASSTETQQTGITAETDKPSNSTGPDISFFSNRPPADSTNNDADGDVDKQDYIHSDLEEEDSTTNATAAESTTTKTTTPAADKEETVTETSTDFSLRAFLQEFAATMENDVRTITKLILPVVQPLFSAGDTAWKYLRMLWKRAKRMSERFQQGGQQQQDSDKPQKSDKESATF